VRRRRLLLLLLLLLRLVLLVLGLVRDRGAAAAGTAAAGAGTAAAPAAPNVAVAATSAASWQATLSSTCAVSCSANALLNILITSCRLAISSSTAPRSAMGLGPGGPGGRSIGLGSGEGSLYRAGARNGGVAAKVKRTLLTPDTIEPTKRRTTVNDGDDDDGE